MKLTEDERQGLRRLFSQPDAKYLFSWLEVREKEYTGRAIHNDDAATREDSRMKAKVFGELTTLLNTVYSGK